MMAVTATLAETTATPGLGDQITYTFDCDERFGHGRPTEAACPSGLLRR
jgi:hypothetical protein